jgi:hypothetical protein
MVQRARNVDQKIASIPEPEERNWNENESLSRGIFRKETMRTVENEDYNSDITAKDIK